MKTKWIRIVYIIGVIALIAGVLDPLEGSVVITAGSLLLAVSTLLMRDRHWKLFLLSFVLIATGVFFLFYFSSLGGFGGKSTLSWWWSTLMLPYPFGWLLAIILLIARSIRKAKSVASPAGNQNVSQ